MSPPIELFTRFNRKNIQDRQIDTLIGLSKGLAADGKIEQAEAEALLAWLIQNRQSTDNPIIVNLLEKVSAMLGDGNLDEEEAKELLRTLQNFTGDPSEIGELGKTSTLPIDAPPPPVTFQNRSFLFTGTFAFGTREQCQNEIARLRGDNAKSVTKALDYLVLGTYVSDSWAHETYGRKIEKAVEYRAVGCPIAIITEAHWVNQAKL